jgi:hypothetical protein
MDFFDVVSTQRAIRRFLPDPVPDALVARARRRYASASRARRGAVGAGRRPRCGLRAEIGRSYLTTWRRPGSSPRRPTPTAT